MTVDPDVLEQVLSSRSTKAQMNQDRNCVDFQGEINVPWFPLLNRFKPALMKYNLADIVT